MTVQWSSMPTSEDQACRVYSRFQAVHPLAEGRVRRWSNVTVTCQCPPWPRIPVFSRVMLSTHPPTDPLSLHPPLSNALMSVCSVLVVLKMVHGNGSSDDDPYILGQCIFFSSQNNNEHRHITPSWNRPKKMRVFIYQGQGRTDELLKAVEGGGGDF